jgi:hypothetical protein
MSKLSTSRFFILSLTLSFVLVSLEAQSFSRPPVKGQKKGLSAIFEKKPTRTKSVKIREPKAAEKAKKKQEAKDKQLKKEYNNFVRKNQKRSIEIQTPAVQERMKQNIKDANARYRNKKKNTSSRTKNAGRKYK